MIKLKRVGPGVFILLGLGLVMIAIALVLLVTGNPYSPVFSGILGLFGMTLGIITLVRSSRSGS